MNDINLKILQDVYKQYVDLESSAKLKFKGTWDDPVHDSFNQYLKDIDEIATQLREINISVQNIQDEISDLHIDEILKDADQLCEEVEAI